MLRLVSLFVYDVSLSHPIVPRTEIFVEVSEGSFH